MFLVKFKWNSVEVTRIGKVSLIKVKEVATVACLTPVPHSFSLHLVVVVGAFKALAANQLHPL